jgi:hypothetical protein
MKPEKVKNFTFSGSNFQYQNLMYQRYLNLISQRYKIGRIIHGFNFSKAIRLNKKQTDG